MIELPSSAHRLASSDRDPIHAFRRGGNAWGIQFHPEFDQQITRAYGGYYRFNLEALHSPIDKITHASEESGPPQLLLARFAQQLTSRPRRDLSNTTGEIYFSSVQILK